MSQKKTPNSGELPPSPPSKKRGTRQRYMPKIAKDVPSKPTTKGISINEPMKMRTTGKHVSVNPKDKGKRKGPPSPTDSSDTSDDVPLRNTTRRVEQEPVIPDITGEGTPRKEASSDSLYEEGDDEANVTTDSHGYVSLPLVYTKKFNESYAERNICKMCYVDLVELCHSTELDLTSFLGQYMPWLSVNTPYCSKIVRQFYCNLTIKDDSAGEVELETSVRGNKFTISSSKINTWLGIKNPPKDGFKLKNEREIFELLLPGEPVRALDFEPASMSDVHRVLWYIYSRNFVNKGGNFSHFTGMDYGRFASFIAKDVRNLGAMILDVLKTFVTQSSKSTPLPFPQLVSLFLEKNGIWYLEGQEPLVRLPKFGRREIDRMGIKLPLIENRVSKQVQPTQEPSADIPSSQYPSFFNLAMKNEIRQAISEVVIPKLEDNQKALFSMISKQVEYMELLKAGLIQLNKLGEDIKVRQESQNESIQAIQARQERLEMKLNDLGPKQDAEHHGPLFNLSTVAVEGQDEEAEEQRKGEEKDSED